jgi:hypothetical protein
MGTLITSPKFGDFMIIDSYVFEIGGSNKTTEQIQGFPNAFLALDIDSGNGKKYLYGYLECCIELIECAE